MKGIVFTEFLELVEEEFGYETVDDLLEKTKLASKGVYTAVGTYDHMEILALLCNLQKMVNVPINDLLVVYGKFLFPKLVKFGGKLVSSYRNSFELLSALDKIIHVEVLKLYPEAELPKFEIQKQNNNELQLIYTSCRPFAYLAKGLIEGCADYYGETIDITLENQNTENEFCSVISLVKQ